MVCVAITLAHGNVRADDRLYVGAELIKFWWKLFSGILIFCVVSVAKHPQDKGLRWNHPKISTRTPLSGPISALRTKGKSDTFWAGPFPTSLSFGMAERKIYKGMKAD